MHVQCSQFTSLVGCSNQTCGGNRNRSLGALAGLQLRSNYGLGNRHLVCSSSGNGDQESRPDQPPPPKPSLVDPVQTVQWGGTLPSPRRAALGGLTGLSIALVGNIFGLTSFLLGLDGGEAARNLRLDAVVPVKGFKRCVDYQNGFEFLVPAAWLADQRLYRRYAERLERERSLDLPPLRSSPRRIRSDDVPEPAAAFGPAGSTGEDNISVIVAPIRDGFTLAKMGTPQEAAERFLSTTVAPEGSGKVAVLVGAGQRRDAVDGELYYQLEFTVEISGKWKRHNVAVYGARNGLLYTLNAQCSEKRWNNEAAGQFATAAKSFRIISSGAGVSGFPDRL